MSYLPMIKIILPYIAPILGAAAPMLTKSSEAEGADDKTQAKQIVELQVAVEKNGASIRLLAEQLEKLVAAFDEQQLAEKGGLEALQQQQQVLQAGQAHVSEALQKFVKDAQITKILAAGAVIAAMAALAVALLK
ncbi:hypothetical protein [Paucibacter sp. XJ19-41]|uniref:hypothetical protein n=1 Tax=Paucibacter sp. XJ19-41 TaxID=2927824 RepID=UPI00234AC58A|nr:hypothetical protein [Paucibacter sp. XJ19-41]MDC6168528.1 hypothetical protein [Paucibacter sp. XJ19-41]